VTGAIRFAAMFEKTGAMRQQAGMLILNLCGFAAMDWCCHLTQDRLMGDPFDLV
jgi:hypothetical protein